MPTILFIPRIPLPGPGRITTGKVLTCPDCGTRFGDGARNCSGCGRVIERVIAAPLGGVGAASRVLSPTAAGAWMVMAILLAIVVGGPIYWWQSQYAHVPKPESEAQQKVRLQSEAEGEMLKECTNVVVGLTRLIRTTLNDADDNYKWSGDVVAEYINRVGGVERTNVFFKFSTDTGTDGLVHLRCSCEPEADRRSRQHNEKR